jgi:hypothetical protein
VLGTSALSIFVFTVHFNGFTSHQMALHDYTLTHPNCKSSFPYCTDILQDTHNLKPYIYLQINTRGAAIKALSIFMDYIK